MAGKSLSVQLSEAQELLATDQVTISDLNEQVTAYQADISAQTVERDALKAEIENLKAACDRLTKANCDLARDLEAALGAVKEFEAKVEAKAADKAAEQLAAQGVPPVAAETTRTASSKDDVLRELEELNQRDPRAAGVFYTQKVRPLIFKET